MSVISPSLPVGLGMQAGSGTWSPLGLTAALPKRRCSRGDNVSWLLMLVAGPPGIATPNLEPARPQALD